MHSNDDKVGREAVLAATATNGYNQDSNLLNYIIRIYLTAIYTIILKLFFCLDL